ncbi:tRNA 2-selenouridine(34) synthase MnmH, partial [bacterium]|nr:tRNA 2-selenouridine(34) synthase MnmH [bacterium]
MPGHIPTLDVRAPTEFEQGHIPGATSFPLFDDHQREVVGTAYRKNGRQKAILIGLEFVGQKMRPLVEAALKLTRHQEGERQVRLHCWRGGMRSQSVEWLLGQADIKVHRLDGGYKSFRQYTQRLFQQPWQLVVLSGLTGAGKTRQLKLLESTGQQILDLEGLANHRGSAFGGIGQADQPTTEQFENLMATQLRSLDPHRRIWVEDESKKVGRCVIPDDLFNQVNGGPAIFMDVPRRSRSQVLHQDYGELDADEMAAAITRITKKLGGQNTNAAIEAIQAGDKLACCEILLDYYDRLYLKATSRGLREVSRNVEIADPESSDATLRLIEAADA